MTLRVADDGRVWVSIPPHISLRAARDFVQNNLHYIRTALHRAQERRAKRNVQWNKRLMLPERGIWLPVVVHEGHLYHITLQPSTLQPSTEKKNNEEEDSTTEATKTMHQTIIITVPELRVNALLNELKQRAQPQQNEAKNTEQSTLYTSEGTYSSASEFASVPASAFGFEYESASLPGIHTRRTHAAHILALQYWRYHAVQRANKELPARTIELANNVGEELRRVSIRDQRTLWGSCSASRRSISLNWRCILFPEKVCDYLILHELAHLRHQDHSERYWNWVAKLCPWYEEAESWIRQHGQAIMDVTVAEQH